MAPFVITGAQGGQTQGAEAPNRLEISDFVKNVKFFSLFIQALGAYRLIFVYDTHTDPIISCYVGHRPGATQVVLPDRWYPRDPVQSVERLRKL